jgi:hypothetical protein
MGARLPLVTFSATAEQQAGDVVVCPADPGALRAEDRLISRCASAVAYSGRFLALRLPPPMTAPVSLSVTANSKSTRDAVSDAQSPRG